MALLRNGEESGRADVRGYGRYGGKWLEEKVNWKVALNATPKSWGGGGHAYR